MRKVNCNHNAEGIQVGKRSVKRLSITLDAGGKCDGLKWDEVLGRKVASIVNRHCRN